MPAGTVTLTNKSAVISGAGTTFTTELAAGDFLIAVVGGIPYNLPIKTVDSNTKMTAISDYLGPTTSGLAWMIAPRSTQNLITAAIVVQNTEALRGFNYDKQNWQQLLTIDDDVTIRLPDNTSWTGSSWIKISRLASASDLSHIQPIADQIRADAQQVATDKTESKSSAAAAKVSETNAATSEANSANSATAAAQSASESAASAESTAGVIDAATAQADRAKNEADRAAASNPANSLLIVNNLNDVESKAEALANLIDSKPLPTGGDPVNPYDAATKRWTESLVNSGIVGPKVTTINADAIAPVTGTLVKGGDVVSMYKVGSVNQISGRVQAQGKSGQDAWVALSIVDETNVNPAQSIKIHADGRVDTPGPVLNQTPRNTSFDGIYSGNRNTPLAVEQLVVPAVDYLYPLTNFKAYWSGHYAQAFATSVWCRATGLVYGITNCAEGGVNKSWFFEANTGNAAAPGSWIPNSDGRIKTDKVRIEDPLGKMRLMGGYTWTRLDSGAWGIGFIAQEVAEIFPDAVHKGEDRTLPDGTVVEGVLSPDTYGVSAALHHEAILALMEKIEKLEARIAELER